MLCPEAAELMSVRLDAELTPEENQQLQEHLAACEDCRVEWEWLQRAHTLFDDVAYAVPSPNLVPKVMAQVRRRSALARMLRSGMIVFLSLLGLGALVGMAWVSLSSLFQPVAGDPSVAASFMGLLIQLLDLCRTVANALGLFIRALLTSTNPVLAITYIILALVLVLFWTRMIARPATWSPNKRD